MSRDQRPARVKLVESAPPAVPVRRADDAAPAPSKAPTAPTASSSGLLYGTVFLVGCMLGAGGMSLLPMLGLH